MGSFTTASAGETQAANSDAATTAFLIAARVGTEADTDAVCAVGKWVYEVRLSACGIYSNSLLTCQRGWRHGGGQAVFMNALRPGGQANSADVGNERERVGKRWHKADCDPSAPSFPSAGCFAAVAFVLATVLATVLYVVHWVRPLYLANLRIRRSLGLQYCTVTVSVSLRAIP